MDRYKYNTRYKVIDSSNKNVLPYNHRSCFSNFCGVGSKLEYFKPDYKMEIYLSESYSGISKEVVEWYVDMINQIGLSVSLSEINITEDKAECKTDVGLNYVVTLDFKDYTSKGQVNFACSMLRYMWEHYFYKLVQGLYDNKDKITKDSFINYFLYLVYLKYENFNEVGGHPVFYPGIAHRLVELKDLEYYFNKWKIYPHTNTEVSAVSSAFRLDVRTKLENTSTFENYIESLNKIKR